MHSTTSTWGKPVNFLLVAPGTTCQLISPSTALRVRVTPNHSGKTRVIQKLTRSFPVRFTHIPTPDPYLLIEQFVHISTGPITMNEKKGLKN